MNLHLQLILWLHSHHLQMMRIQSCGMRWWILLKMRRRLLLTLITLLLRPWHIHTWRCTLVRWIRTSHHIMLNDIVLWRRHVLTLINILRRSLSLILLTRHWSLACWVLSVCLLRNLLHLSRNRLTRWKTLLWNSVGWNIMSRHLLAMHLRRNLLGLSWLMTWILLLYYLLWWYLLLLNHLLALSACYRCSISSSFRIRLFLSLLNLLLRSSTASINDLLYLRRNSWGICSLWRDLYFITRSWYLNILLRTLTIMWISWLIFTLVEANYLKHFNFSSFL